MTKVMSPLGNRYESPPMTKKLTKTPNLGMLLPLSNTKLVSSRGTRRFLIQWAPYDGISFRDTWEPEKLLDDCVSTLQKYWIRNGLKPSTLEGHLGAEENEPMGQQH